MLSLSLDAVKLGFFDRAAITNAVDAASRRNLSKFGAFVRQRAKTSIRYRYGAAAPGQPPHAHRTGVRRRKNKKTGQVKPQAASPLREFIFFRWDSGEKSVVVGPVLLNAAKGKAEALSALERGGVTTITSGKKNKKVSIEARPFMGPAAAAEGQKLPELWRDSIK